MVSRPVGAHRAAPARRAPAAGTVRRGVWQKLGHLGVLGLSNAGITVAAFGTQVLLARGLSQADFGTFMAVTSLTSLTAPLAVFGVSEFWLQRFGREGARAFRWVPPSTWLVVACSATIMLAIVAWGLLDRADPAEGKIRALLAPIVVAQAAIALSGSVLQLRGRYGGLATIQLVPHAGRVLIALATSALGLSALVTAVGYSVTAVLTVAICLTILGPFWRGEMRLEGHDPSARAPSARPPRLRHLIAGASPFLFGSVFYLLGINLGIILSNELLGPERAAVLAVPMAILTAIYLVPRVVYQQYLLAKLHRWSRSDREAFLAAYRLGTVGMLSLGALVAVVVAATAWFAIPLVFGPPYRSAAPIMAVLALAIPCRFGAASVASLLTTGGLVRRKVLYQGIGSVVYVGGLALAMPRYGLTGAAVATVAAEFVLLVIFWTAVRRRVVAGAHLPTWASIITRLTRRSPNG
jgi:O-antigen/teichoic acid export membrane protein